MPDPLDTVGESLRDMAIAVIAIIAVGGLLSWWVT